MTEAKHKVEEAQLKPETRKKRAGEKKIMVGCGGLLIVSAISLATVYKYQPATNNLVQDHFEGPSANDQYRLGSKYRNGTGVPKDDAEAVKWYRKAADQGDASAQHNLGAMYAAGEGVPKGDAEAVEWYRKAADQGDASAQHNLGLMYAAGEGVPKGDAEAVKWLARPPTRGTRTRNSISV